MDPNQATALASALAALIGAIATLVAVIRNGQKLTTIHANTNSTLAALTAKADTATEQRATAAELEARPRLNTPKIP